MLWEIKDTYAALLLKSVIPVRRPNVYSGGGRCVCKRCSGRSRGLYFSVLPGEAAVQLGKRSGYHLFLSRNINAFGEGDRVDYAKLSFGGACLQLPDRFACVQNETGHWELVWQAGYPGDGSAGRPFDSCRYLPGRTLSVNCVGKYLRAQKRWTGRR